MHGKEDCVSCPAGMRACWEVLDAMKRRGLHMDPQMGKVHGQLAWIFSG